MHTTAKALLVKRKISQTSIAHDLGVKPCAVSGPLNGLWRSERVETHIATILGRRREKLFGKAA